MRPSRLHGKDGLTPRIRRQRRMHHAELIDLTGKTPCEGGVHRSARLRRGQEKPERKRGLRSPKGTVRKDREVKGKKRHLLVDTQGLVLHAIVHAADIQDRDGGVLVMATLFGMYPFLLKLYADGGYQGPQFRDALQRVVQQVNVEIVKRSDSAKGFTVLPKRWIVERTIGWLNRCRRLAKDWECLNRSALAFLRWSSIRMMLRRLCQISK